MGSKFSSTRRASSWCASSATAAWRLGVRLHRAVTKPATCLSARSVASVCNARVAVGYRTLGPSATLAPGGNVLSAGGLLLWAPRRRGSVEHREHSPRVPGELIVPTYVIEYMALVRKRTEVGE